MIKKSALLTFIILFSSLLEISAVYAGAYQSTCPAKKFAKIEADIRKNFKPRKTKNGPPDTVDRRIKNAFKKCRVPIQITGEEIISPEETIPVTRVTSWIKSGYSNRRVNTGVTTTIIFGPLGALGFLSKKHRYNFIVKGFNEEGKQATIQISHIEEIIQLNNLTEGARYSDNYNGYRISFVLGENYEFQIEKILTVDNSLLLVHSETGYCELINN